MKIHVLLAILVAPTAFAQNTDQLDKQQSVQLPAVVFTAQERQKILSHGPWPVTPAADPGNELSGLLWAENLGKLLFNEQALSANKSLACSSCHQESLGFSDGQPVATGVKPHFRNTLGLLNSGNQRWLGWDGGADSLWAAALRPLLSDIEMGGTIKSIASSLRSLPYYLSSIQHSTEKWELYTRTDEMLVITAAKAIAAYNRTLLSGETAFDHFRAAIKAEDLAAQQNYPEAAKRGLRTFIGDANCQVCHFGPQFSNGEFHDIGRPFFVDVGVVDSGRYSGIERVRQDRYNLAGPFNGTLDDREILKTRSVKLSQSNFGQWRTPSLRNLSSTAPYMHDGSIQTLREVVDTYADIDITRLHTKGEAILKPLTLSDSERDDLVEFLKTLSSQ